MNIFISKKKVILFTYFCWFGATALSFWSLKELYNTYYRQKSLRYDIGALESYSNLVPLLVVGSGPAGLSAALYGARARLYTVVLAGPLPGGQLTGTSFVENWPGTSRLLGSELIGSVRKQAEEFGASIINESAESIDASSWPFKVTLGEGRTLYALAVILASGATPKRLGVPGEDQYWGKGVTTCATCDAPYFKDKQVIVIGGGDSAIEEAIQLSAYARSITILVRKENMRAAPAMQERLVQFPSISVRYTTEVIKIMGDDQKVTQVVLRDTVTKATSDLPIDGVFLAIGHEPNTASVKKALACDKEGYVLLESGNQQTSAKGIFAAGDVADRVYKQAGVAAGDGIKAALDAEAFLRDCGWNALLATSLEHRFFNPKTVRVPELREITDKKSFDKLLQNSSLPVVVLFSGTACPACVKMLPLVQAAAAELSEKALFVKIDTALDGIADTYDIQRIPLLAVIKKGTVVARKEGAHPKAELMSFLGTHI